MSLGNRDEKSNILQTQTMTLASLNKIKIGKVDSVNSDATLNIELLEYKERVIQDKRRVVKQTYKQPLLTNVPVLYNNAISTPYAKGDTVFIGFTDHYFTNNFYKKSSPYTTNPMLMHSLANAFVLGTAPSLGSNIKDEEGNVYQNDRAFIKDKNTNITLKDNKVKIKNPNQDIKTLLDGVIDGIIDGVKVAFGTALYGSFPIANKPAVDLILDQIKTLQKTEVGKLFYD